MVYKHMQEEQRHPSTVNPLLTGQFSLLATNHSIALALGGISQHKLSLIEAHVESLKTNINF